MFGKFSFGVFDHPQKGVKARWQPEDDCSKSYWDVFIDGDRFARFTVGDLAGSRAKELHSKIGTFKFGQEICKSVKARMGCSAIELLPILRMKIDEL